MLAGPLNGAKWTRKAFLAFAKRKVKAAAGAGKPDDLRDAKPDDVPPGARDASTRVGGLPLFGHVQF